VRYVDGGDSFKVFAAIEARYIAVDSHRGAVGFVFYVACHPVFIDGKGSIAATTHYLYGSTRSGCLEVELYLSTVGNGKGDVAAHVYCLCLSGGTREKPYCEGEK